MAVITCDIVVSSNDVNDAPGRDCWRNSFLTHRCGDELNILAKRVTIPSKRLTEQTATDYTVCTGVANYRHTFRDKENC